MTRVGGLKLTPAPVKRGWKPPPVPLFCSVSVATPLIVLVLMLRSTVAALLLVVIALGAVTLIGLAIGSVLAVRVAVVLRLPPLRISTPVASPRRPSPSTLIWPALICVSPLYVLSALF